MTAATPDETPLPIVQPGTLLADTYRVEGLLGQGAMGVVVAARPVRGGDVVAVKLLLPSALDRHEALARFEREVQLVRKLHSQHVARVLDAGTHHDGSPFMVIEYLRGHDLSHELAERGPLPVAEAVSWILQALEALAEAHALGIVHRDLKPSNLFLAEQPDGSRRLKVLDFGISKQHPSNASESPAVSLTKTHSLIGSPLYMSPEQVLAAKHVDAQSDLWSLGVVLFELLAGKPPFDGTNVGQVLSNVMSAPLPSLRDPRPDLPAGLDAVLACVLERVQSKRYRHAAQFARALAPFASADSQPLLARIESFAPPSTDDLPPDTERLAAAAAPDTLPNAVPSPLASAARAAPVDATLPSARQDEPETEVPAPTPQVSPLRGPLVALAILLALVAAAFVGRWLTLRP